MIILTGAAGFIGSCMLARLLADGYGQVVIVDEFSRPDKNKNFEGKPFLLQMHRNNLFDWLTITHRNIEAIIHLGARTDTTETNKAIFDELNLHYSQAIWQYCTRQQIPLIYASSAATYGLGEHGYSDDHALVEKLQPLNPYGESKNDFDKWVLQQAEQPPFWVGLKFFNVYGPNEYHKGRMASVIFHAFRQIQATGSMKLFRSHNANYSDGGQMRDFVYVKDVVNVIAYLLAKQPAGGLYNLGTGKARTFLDLATQTFAALHFKPEISFIDTPADIRDTYQYFTEAKMDKLLATGYTTPFHSLEEGIHDYVANYLLDKQYI